MAEAAEVKGAAPDGPRTVLVTGSGGAGRTTIAAATALSAARRGERTLLLSPEPAGVLQAVLAPAGGSPACRVGGSGRPAEAATDLWVERIDSGEEFRTRTAGLLERSGVLFDLLGSAPPDAQELTELPGAAEFAVLRGLSAAHGRTPGWDRIVVDMPPAPDTVRLLALPEQLCRYLRRLLPPERQAARALRPLLAQLAGVPMPARTWYDTADRWQRELAEVQQVLAAPATTVRLVVEPTDRALAGLGTVRAALALFGLAVDAVLVNRLLPDGSADDWLRSLAGGQRTAMARLRAGDRAAAAEPMLELPHLGREAAGLDALAELADRSDPDGWAAADSGAAGGGAGAVGAVGAEVVDRLAEEGRLVWRLPLPGALREEVRLVRRGAELIVAVGPFRRILPLPSALRRCVIDGAALADGALSVRFEPDPALWPRGVADRC